MMPGPDKRTGLALSKKVKFNEDGQGTEIQYRS
jgi:hypothetical protein